MVDLLDKIGQLFLQTAEDDNSSSIVSNRQTNDEKESKNMEDCQTVVIVAPPLQIMASQNTELIVAPPLQIMAPQCSKHLDEVHIHEPKSISSEAIHESSSASNTMESTPSQLSPTTPITTDPLHPPSPIPLSPFELLQAAARTCHIPNPSNKQDELLDQFQTFIVTHSIPSEDIINQAETALRAQPWSFHSIIHQPTKEKSDIRSVARKLCILSHPPPPPPSTSSTSSKLSETSHKVKRANTNDLLAQRVDVIVNPSNTTGHGCHRPNETCFCLDHRMIRMGGWRIRQACQGRTWTEWKEKEKAFMTTAGAMPYQCIVQTHPLSDRRQGQTDPVALEQCYKDCLDVIDRACRNGTIKGNENKVVVVGMPLMGARMHGWKVEDAELIAETAIEDWLEQHPTTCLSILLVIHQLVNKNAK